MNWYEVHAPEGALPKIFKSLRKQKLLVRRRDNGPVFTCISSHHIGWLDRVCGDFNGTTTPLKYPPAGLRVPRKEEYKAPCGEMLYDPILFTHHMKNCPECKKEPSKVVAKVAPGAPLNLDGVIASLEEVHGQLFEQLEEIDGLLTNLKAYRDAKVKITDLESEVKLRIQAVKLVVQNGNL